MGKYTIYKQLFENESLSLQDLDEYEKRAIKYIIQLNTSRSSIENWVNTSPRDAMKENKILDETKYSGKDPVKLANSTKDLKKLYYRLSWCYKYWSEAVNAFENAIANMLVKDHYYDVQRIADEFEDNDNKRLAQIKQKRGFDNIMDIIPTSRDWEKMVDYMDKKSDTDRLASSTKDVKKLVSRYAISNCLGWKKAADAFRNKLLDNQLATEKELNEYSQKYNEIPEQYKEYIVSVKDNLKSGLNTIGTDNDKIQASIRDILDDLPNIEKYEKLKDFQFTVNLIKITTINDNEYYLMYPVKTPVRNLYGEKYFSYYRIFKNMPTDEDVIDNYHKHYEKTRQTFLGMLKIRLADLI